jgi:aryl-alcohol dehydrogenase-like predicted oxidoreductase
MALPKRTYKPGIEVSIIAAGGVLVMNETPEFSARIVSEVVERGVNYFDVAPSYGDAEIKLGPALEPYRKNCFLACKTGHRDAAGAAAELKQSFERLRTDYFDLYQLHHITTVKEDVDAVFARGGAMEVIDAAKKDGGLRHVGFSAHSVEAALAALDRYAFDSVMFPVNFATFHKGNFGPQIIERARKQGVTVVAIKALAKGKWPADHPLRQQYNKCWYEPLTDPREVDLALRFTLSQPVATAIPPGHADLFRMALDIASNFKPLSPAEQQQARDLAQRQDVLFEAA